MRHPRFWAAAMIAGFIVAGSSAASAHAVLESTSPTQGSEVAAAPTEVRLHFGEGVGINQRSLEVLDPDGKRVDNGSPVHPGGDSTTVEVRLRTGLPRASYAVLWHVVSADSHPVGGTFSFGIGVPAGATPADAGGSRLVGALAGGFRTVAYVGAAMLGGGLFFLLVIWPAGLLSRAVRNVVVAGWAASVAAAVALFGLEGPYGAGLGLGALVQRPLLRTTLGTDFGKLLLARVVLLAVAVPLLRALAPDPDAGIPALSSTRRRMLAGLGVLGAATFSLGEHSGQGIEVPVAAPLDVLHVLAASIWLGGLLILAAGLLAPAYALSLRDLMPRWSQVGIGCVSTLLATGLYLSWREVGFSLGALTATTYGAILLTKVGLFAVMLGFAEFGRRWIGTHATVRSATTPAAAPASFAAVAGRVESEVTTVSAGRSSSGVRINERMPEPSAMQAGSGQPGSGQPGRRPPGVPARAALRSLRTSVAAEAGIGVGVLVATSLLVNGLPARQAYTSPYSANVTGVDADGEKISVTIDLQPANVGRDAVHLYTFTAKGAVLPFDSVDGSLVNKEKGVGPVDFTFDNTGPGHGTANGVVVPTSGLWTLTAEIHTDALTDYAATTTIPVR